MLTRKLTLNLMLVSGVLLCLMQRVMAQVKDTTINIPLGGNAWIDTSVTAKITNAGLVKWSSGNEVVSVYLSAHFGGEYDVSLRLKVPAGESTIKLIIGDNDLTKTIKNTADFQVVNFGKMRFRLGGYTKFVIIGLAKSGEVFADVSDLVLSGPAYLKDAIYVPDNHNNYFYWGRRGSSVHLRYEVTDKPIEWFYNEVTVPPGRDVIGSYFMADGFTGGYFGMQVNSATERRLLFSVWSPYQTNDPKTIPDYMRVKLVKKGATVHGGEFGGEGSGGQSYMLYPWEAGKTYCFLLHAQGDIAAETTIYTAYFKPKDALKWQLIASFKRPQSGDYLKGLHSFVENFDPDYGDQNRLANFTNAWTVDTDGQWTPIYNAIFTTDETGRLNYRADYGVSPISGGFFLQNGGFFDGMDSSGTKLFSDEHKYWVRPVIKFKKLP